MMDAHGVVRDGKPIARACSPQASKENELPHFSQVLTLLGVKALWSQRIAFFWPIWGAMTVALAACSAWAVQHASGSPLQNRRISLPQPTPRGRYVALALFVLFCGLYAAMMLVWEDFARYDSSQLTLYSLKGHAFQPPIWREMGRFFPLAFQEFNVIGRVFHTAAGFMLLPVVQFLLLCTMLASLDTELSVRVRVAIAAIVCVTPSFAISFTGLTYPERNVIFWLVCLIFLLHRFERTLATAYAAAVIVCAQFFVYYKELAALFLLTFALVRLALRWQVSENRSKASWLWTKESILDLGLLTVAGGFCLLYLVMMLPHLNMHYARQQALPIRTVVGGYLRLDLMPWLLLGSLAVRLPFILRGKIRASPLWDGLAMGGLAYFAGYVWLHMFSAYYLAPVDLIAGLYTGCVIVQSWESVRGPAKAVLATVVVLAVVQNLAYASFRVYEDKNDIRAKSQIAAFIVRRYRDDPKELLRLYLPFASRYSIMEFASFLAYKGLPVEMTAENVPLRDPLEFMSPQATSNGPCVAFRDVLCHASAQPERGDLVVILPDDAVDISRAHEYCSGSGVSFCYKAYPVLPGWFRNLLAPLHIVSIPFAAKPLSDHWVHASVTVWK